MIESSSFQNRSGNSSPTSDPAVILLDLDGTLVDSEGLAAQVFERYCLERGIVPGREKEISTSVVGRTWRNGLVEAQARGARFQEDLRVIENLLNEDYRKRLESEGVPEVPGAAQAVQRLAQDFRVAVVSGSQRREIEWNLKVLGISGEIEFYLGAEDVVRGKPEPDPFLEGMRRFSVLASSVVIFEDSVAGLLAARRAKAGLIVAIEHANRLGQDQSAADIAVKDWKGIDAAWIRRTWIR